MSVRPWSRARRRAEHAAARMVGSAADPDLAVRARRRLLVWDELAAADDPTLAGHRDLVGRLAVVVAAAPLAGRIAKAAAVDLGVMRRGQRCLRARRQDERNPEQGNPAGREQGNPAGRRGWARGHRVAPRSCRRSGQSAASLVPGLPPGSLPGIAAVAPCLRHLAPGAYVSLR